MNERQSWNIIVIFLLLIFGISAATLLHHEKSFSERENRALQTKPEMSVTSILDGTFESDYENYLTDQFVGRDSWIALKTSFEQLTGRTEAHDVYFADDDYLIEKHTGTFTSDSAERNVRLLQQFAEKMSGTFDDTHFSVVIVPNAVDILRDKLPALAAPYDEEEYLAHIREGIPEGVWVDATDILKRHTDEQLYYRTDHHWKTAAAYYLWEAVAEKMSLASVSRSDYTVTQVTDDFEGTVAAKVGTGVKADSIEVFRGIRHADYLLTYNKSDDVRSTVYQKNALEGRDQYSYFYGGNYALVEADTKAKSDRRVLVIKDSYAHAFVPFLYDYCEKVDMLDLRYYNESLQTLMDEKKYTDVIVLYNAAGFAEDASLAKLLS